MDLNNRENQIFTQEKVNITKRIANKQTLIFFNENEAMVKAEQMRSYVYRAYDSKNNFYGYAVPK